MCVFIASSLYSACLPACSSPSKYKLYTCVFYIHIQHFIFLFFISPLTHIIIQRKMLFLIVKYVGLPCSTFYTKISEWPRVNVHEFLKSPQTKVHFLFSTTQVNPTPHVWLLCNKNSYIFAWFRNREILVVSSPTLLSQTSRATVKLFSRIYITWQCSLFPEQK